MSSLVKDKAPEILEAIKSSVNILMHCHPSPDPDSVGSVLAMLHVLDGMGKKATAIIGDSEKPESMSHFPGFDRILSKNWGDIKPEEYDLLIAMDSSSKDMISQKHQVVFPDGMKVIVIDHHISNTNYGNINLVPDYPATGQVLFKLFKEWGIKLTPEIAANLFMSIYYDTGGLQYPPTDSQTYKVVGELVELCPNFSGLLFTFFNQNDPETLRFLAIALKNLNKYFNGNVVVSEVRLSELQEAKIDPLYTSKTEVVNKIISVRGWNIGISLFETDENEIHLSFRTRDREKYDVSKIAVAMGGGGHKAAAGVTVRKTFSEAKKLLLDTIQKLYPELGNP